MTRAELREAIKREARVKTASNLDTFINDLMLEILRDHANKARYPELLTLDEPITLVNEQSSYDLPAGFVNLANLRYGVGPNPMSWTPILPVPASYRFASQVGFPLYYRLAVGNKITLWPFQSVRATDTLLLDFYIDPGEVFNADDDDFPIPSLESVVKKSAIARLQRYHQSLPEAQLMEKDTSGSFVAVQSKTP